MEARLFATKQNFNDALAAFQAGLELTDKGQGEDSTLLAESIIDLTARGVQPSALLAAFEKHGENRQRTDATLQTPFVVALRLEAGIEVRAPNEVLEVAKDIRDEIASRREQLANRSSVSS